MDVPIFGYWVDHPDGIYFVRGAFEALPEHTEAFDAPMEGVTVTPVTEFKDIAHYVILRHLKKGVIIYTKWIPNIPRPLEVDHTGEVAFEVVDFAESVEEAEAVVKQLKSQK